MAKRRVNASMLQTLVKESANQEISRGPKLTYDSNFPVFRTPVNEDIIVYIPKVNLVTDETGSVMNMLESHLHTYQNGNSFGSLRCISGLQFDELGYDGTCPACDAMTEVWELYNLKYAKEAQRMAVDPDNDKDNVLQPIRQKLSGEMDVKNPEAYVTFPVVIIPTKAKFVPADDAMDRLEVVYVHWRKQRYDDSIGAALNSMMTNPGHPAGMFWFWKFSYDTKGKQATARDSAKNAKYSIIQENAVLETLAPFVAKAEEKAKDFTVEKAAEVVVATEFLFKEDLEAEVNKVMKKTRTALELAKTGGTPALEAGQPAGQLGGANPLASFGQATPENAGVNLGTAPDPNSVPSFE